MEVHHSFDVKSVAPQAVHDCVWKALKVQFAVLTPDLSPTSRLSDDTAESAFKLVDKIVTKSWLPTLIP
jgi:hypothetical protein